MVQYTTLLVAAAVLSAAVPALADSVTPRLNRRSARELYRRGQAHEPSTMSRRSLYYSRGLPQGGGQTEAEKKAAEEKKRKDKEEKEKAKDDAFKEAARQAARNAVGHRRDMEELLRRMLERQFYDDLD